MRPLSIRAWLTGQPGKGTTRGMPNTTNTNTKRKGNRALPITMSEREREMLRVIAVQQGVSMAEVVRACIRKLGVDLNVRVKRPRVQQADAH